jgi:hypothetical protein
MAGAIRPEEGRIGVVEMEEAGADREFLPRPVHRADRACVLARISLETTR